MSKQLSSLKEKIAELEAANNALTASINERQQVVAYLAGALMRLNSALENSPIFPLPEKVNIIFILRNLPSIISILKELFEVIRDFRQNIRINNEDKN